MATRPPGFRKEGRCAEEGRQGAELVVHRDPKRLENASYRILGRAAGVTGKWGGGRAHDRRERPSRRERRMGVGAEDRARERGGVGFIGVFDEEPGQRGFVQRR